MIVFDLDDTLYLRVTPFGQAVTERFGPYPQATVEKMFTDFREIGAGHFRHWGAGEISEQEMYIRRTIDTFALYQIPLTEEEAALFHRTYEKYLQQIRLASGIDMALQTAADRNLRMGIITNGNARRQRRKMEVLGLFSWISPEQVATTEELGVHKPDPQTFVCYREKMLAQFPDIKIRAEEEAAVWTYVGDLYAHDILPPAQAGWQTIWMARRGEDRTEALPVAPTYIVHNGAELAEIFRTI